MRVRRTKKRRPVFQDIILCDEHIVYGTFTSSTRSAGARDEKSGDRRRDELAGVARAMATTIVPAKPTEHITSGNKIVHQHPSAVASCIAVCDA